MENYDGQVVIGTKLDTKEFDAQIDKVEQDINELTTLLNDKNIRLSGDDAQKYSIELEKAVNKLIDLRKQKEKANAVPINNDVSKLGEILNTTGHKIDKIVKKVFKWSLAVIGVRSIYLGIRQAINMITQSDKQLKTDIDYLKFAISNTLKPAIEWIVNAFYNILKFVGLVVKFFTNKNIFANSGAKDFEKSMKNSASSAKELKKQLAGFDEANVLSKNQTDSGTGTPTRDLAKEIDQISQETMQKNVENFFNDIGKATDTARGKLQDYQDELHKLGETDFSEYEEWGVMTKGVVDMLTGLTDIVGGVWDVIRGFGGMFVDMIKGDWNAVWEDIKLIGKGIGEVFQGVVEFIIGLFETLIGFIIGVLYNIGVFVGDALKFIMDLINSFFDWVGGIINKVLSFIWDIIKAIGSFIWDVIMGIWDILCKVCGWIGDLFKGLWDGIVNIFKGVGSFFKGVGNAIWDAFKWVGDKVGGMFKGLWDGIVAVGKGALNGLIGLLNGLIDGLNLILTPLRAIIMAVGNIFGAKWTMDTIKIPRIPKLAVGAIVNNPGKGVMMGNYIAGERGREGVIPLTDPSAMSALGQEIARYVNINNAVELNIDSRRLGRVMQQSQMNSDFARNV